MQRVLVFDLINRSYLIYSQFGEFISDALVPRALFFPKKSRRDFQLSLERFDVLLYPADSFPGLVFNDGDLSAVPVDHPADVTHTRTRGGFSPRPGSGGYAWFSAHFSSFSRGKVGA